MIRQSGFSSLCQSLIDAWLAADEQSHKQPENIYGGVLQHLSIKMRLTVINIRADDPMDWQMNVIRQLGFKSRLLPVDGLLSGRMGDFEDQSYLHDAVFPNYQLVITSRKPAIDFVQTKLFGLNLGYSRILLPQKTTSLPEWLITMTEGRFLMKRIAHHERLDVADERITQLLMEGMTSKEIAEAIGLSARTVEHRLERLKERYGARNTVHLASMLLGSHLETR